MISNILQYIDRIKCFLCSIYYNNCSPLTPMSDQERISPHNINTITTIQVMRIEKNVNVGINSQFNTKFSELKL